LLRVLRQNLPQAQPAAASRGAKIGVELSWAKLAGKQSSHGETSNKGRLNSPNEGITCEKQSIRSAVECRWESVYKQQAGSLSTSPQKYAKKVHA